MDLDTDIYTPSFHPNEDLAYIFSRKLVIQKKKTLYNQIIPKKSY